MPKTKLSMLFKFFGALAALVLWSGCGDDSGSTSPSRNSSAVLSSSGGSSTLVGSSGELLSSLSSSEALLSSSSALPDSTEDGVPYCAPQCDKSKMYAVGERCMWLFKNWVAVQETNQMPTTRPEHWTNEGRCHQNTIIE